MRIRTDYLTSRRQRERLESHDPLDSIQLHTSPDDFKLDTRIALSPLHTQPDSIKLDHDKK